EAALRGDPRLQSLSLSSSSSSSLTASTAGIGSKDRSRSPIERLVVAPGVLGIHGNHLYSHPLALTKNSVAAADSTRGGPLNMTTTAAHTNRPSVITCAPANNRNCNLSHCPVSQTGNSNNYKRANTQHARATRLIEGALPPQPGQERTRSRRPAATNSVSITGSVDDHFAKALGDTWLQIKNKGSPFLHQQQPKLLPQQPHGPPSLPTHRPHPPLV
ncbi:hypothetical protein CRUP_002350, partial [Coryphaenoides rupestris]